MKLELLKEPFKEDEIEWRVGQCGKRGQSVWATCLAYVSARAIMDRLDSVCGPENWKVSYSFVPASDKMDPGVVCKLSILVEGRWVTKEDGAEQTDIESFKGGISSALKRAGSAWGIGRYLYDLESGFAKIVDNRDQGRWGQTKDKVEFYWVPPALPKWALPLRADADKNEKSALPDITPKTEKQKSTSGDPLGSGAFCDECNTELKLSQAGTGYYCPRFREPGEHTRFPTDQLQGVINVQTQERARA